MKWARQIGNIWEKPLSLGRLNRVFWNYSSFPKEMAILPLWISKDRIKTHLLKNILNCQTPYRTLRFVWLTWSNESRGFASDWFTNALSLQHHGGNPRETESEGMGIFSTEWTHPTLLKAAAARWSENRSNMMKLSREIFFDKCIGKKWK